MDACTVEFEILDRGTMGSDQGSAPVATKMRDIYGRVAGVGLTGDGLLTITALDKDSFLSVVAAVEAASGRRQMFFVRGGTAEGKDAIRGYCHARTMSAFQGADGA